MNQSRKVLADGTRARQLEDVGVPLDDLIEKGCPRWLVVIARRSGVVRGLLAFWRGREYALIVTYYHQTGWLPLMLLEAWLGRNGRRVVVLEFLRGRPPKRGLRALIYPFWHGLLVKPAVQRAMIAGHVLTDWERRHYAEMFEVPAERFHFIPWPQRWAGDTLPNHDTRVGEMIVSSGRAACDWVTLSKAAEGRSWPLTIICGKRDLPCVQKLNQSGRARVLCDISPNEHQERVSSATVYVLSLKETEMSSGQVRVMNAIRAATPIVASKISGLDGYLIDGQTAVLVEPGDYLGLRHAIENLLAHPDYRQQLTRAAFESAGERTFEQYIASIRKLVLTSLELVSRVNALPTPDESEIQLPQDR